MLDNSLTAKMEHGSVRKDLINTLEAPGHGRNELLFECASGNSVL